MMRLPEIYIISPTRPPYSMNAMGAGLWAPPETAPPPVFGKE